tara:strand:- start:5777 stop:6097 length:321 start_codon:yes stop_codon:yes gene_type:complete
MVTIEDFQKLDLKIAKILTAERVEDSEKLLKLQVDLGNEQRQIIAGIAKTHNPEDLVGKSIVLVTNLEPRTLMGQESQGMLLAADKEGEPVLLHPEEDVLPGTIIK